MGIFYAIACGMGFGLIWGYPIEGGALIILAAIGSTFLKEG